MDTFFDETSGNRPKAVITFDDAYAGAVRHAIPALLERGLPSTIFIVSSWVGGEIAWWDALAGSKGLSEPFRHQALYRHAGLGSAVMDRARLDGILPAKVCADRRIASTEDIQQIDSSPLVSIAMHGHAHTNLCALGDDELVNELAASFRETRANFPSARAWLAFPYGISDPRVVEAARLVGFERAFLASGGPIRSFRHIDNFAVPRVNVPRGATVQSLQIRVAGLI